MLSVAGLPTSLLPSVARESVISSRGTGVNFIPLGLPTTVYPVHTHAVIAPFALGISFLCACCVVWVVCSLRYYYGTGEGRVATGSEAGKTFSQR